MGMYIYSNVKRKFLISLYHLASHTPPEAMYKENKMSRTNGQCRVLTITSLKMGTCVTTFKGFGDQKKFLGAPQNEKNWFSQ